MSFLPPPTPCPPLMSCPSSQPLVVFPTRLLQVIDVAFRNNIQILLKIPHCPREEKKGEKGGGGGEDKKKSPKKQNRDPARNLSVSIRQGHTRCEGCGALAHKRPPRGRGTGAGVRPVRERLRCPPRGSGQRHNVPLRSRSRSGSSACPPPHIYYYFLVSSGPLHAET